MARYFLEVGYKGTNYAGFQVQENANTIQHEVERALQTFFRIKIHLTGSSRTDAGVHALQNFFHFDADFQQQNLTKAVYHLNAILPPDIVIRAIFRVKNTAHSRFDAVSRTYRYTFYQNKNPFLYEQAWFVPYEIDLVKLNEAAAMVLSCTNFKNFSKKNTQVFTYNCTILQSEWIAEQDFVSYTVTGNRFLRGMVRGLVATMLLVARKKLDINTFKKILDGDDNSSKANFSAPANGLCLQKVAFNTGLLLE